MQLEVNGKLQTKQTGNAKTFAFTLDTSKEGSYEILLTFTKKNYATRVFNYTIARVFDADAQRRPSAPQQLRLRIPSSKTQPLLMRESMCGRTAMSYPSSRDRANG